MNRRDDAQAAPVSDERPARFCDDAWPAPFFDPRRVATIGQQKVANLSNAALHACYRCENRKAWTDAKDNCLVMLCAARKPEISRELECKKEQSLR